MANIASDATAAAATAASTIPTAISGKEAVEEKQQESVPSQQPGRPGKLPRRQKPPLPDLRLERAYRQSIMLAVEERKWYLVAWITLRDQVLLQLAQGFVWSLSVLGFRIYSRYVRANGHTWGDRVSVWMSSTFASLRKRTAF